MKSEKVEGAASVMTFLGIQLDMVKGTMSLLSDKIAHYREEFHRWSDCKATRKRELLSLIGKLSHAYRVIRWYNIIQTHDLYGALRLDYWVRLNHNFWFDLWWWIFFLDTWNGTAQLRP